MQKLTNPLAKKIQARASLIWAILAAVAACAVVYLFRTCVPLNMDEFVSYQTLVCFAFPHAAENVFCSACSSFYLRVLDRFVLPLLTYDYIGSLTSLLYAPLYFLWPSPLSARVGGVLALFIQALVIGRLFSLRSAAVFCCLVLFVPYSFVHIADTGPVAFQVTSVYIIAYCLHRWVLESRWQRRAGLVAIAGFMFALGCWVKPTYFFAMPGVVVIAFAALVTALVALPGQRLARLAEYALFAACAAVPALLIYEARHLDGTPYLPVLNAQFVPSQVVWQDLGRRFVDNVLPFLVNPLNATYTCFGLPSSAASATGLAACAAGAAVMLCGVFLPGIGRRHRLEIIANYCLAAVALVLVATNVYAKSMHHAVLAYPFLVMAAARAVQARPRAVLPMAAVAVFVLLNASLYFQFPRLAEVSRSQANPKAFVAALNDELNKSDASDCVIASVDWGIFFVKSLYGPRQQAVLSLCQLKDGQLEQAAGIARRLRRDLAIVGLKHNQQARALIRKSFPGATERPAGGAGSPWAVWRIPLAGP